MMQRELAAIVLCVFAQAASAQCTAAAVTPTAQTDNNATTQTAARPGKAGGGELIKTAAAGTRDDAPPSARSTVSQHAGQDEDHPRRGGTAMLLAAIALMSGIALRRYGNRNS
jgi:hypothetical protein